MAIVTSDVVSAIKTDVRDIFSEWFPQEVEQAGARSLVMEMRTAKATVEHTWLGTVPQLTETDNRAPTAQGLEVYGYTLSDKRYGTSFEVSKKAIEDDDLQWIPTKSRQLARRAAQFVNSLIFKAQKNGASTTVNPAGGFPGPCYTGKAFYATDHSINGQTIDNTFTKTGVFHDELAGAQAQMMEFVDDQGEPMGLTGNIVVVPPEMFQTAYAALAATNQTQIKTGSDAIVSGPVAPAGTRTFEAGGYRVIVNPYLTAADEWYLCADDGMFRPFILQVRQDFEVYGPESNHMPDGTPIKLFKYGVDDGRIAVGYGDPRHSIKIA